MTEEVAREEDESMNQNESPIKQQGTTPQSTSTSSPKVIKGKSCKGTLYYSSSLKSNARNPLCVGFTTSLSQGIALEESRGKASVGVTNQTDFRYGCVGYSLYKDCKNQPNGASDSQTDLPLCIGLEVLVDRRPKNSESTAVIHNKEDPLRRPQQPVHSFGDEFLGKFTRNANLVAMGVVKNLRKVGNRIKDSVDDILYPYRRPPK